MNVDDPQTAITELQSLSAQAAAEGSGIESRRTEAFSMKPQLPDEPAVAAEVCFQAATIVTSQRESAHGASVRCHRLIAQLWSDYLGEEVKPVDVAQMMVLMKVARSKVGDPTHRDHYVDQAGYSGLAYEMVVSDD